MAKYVDEQTKVIDYIIDSLKLTVNDSLKSFSVEEVNHINRKIETLKMQKSMYIKCMRKDAKINRERKPSSFLLNMRKTLDILNSI